ncbi:putative chaperonin 60 subunit beta 4, chloroplastic-like [Capsicum annuum]|uniref:Ubiquitin-like protease family profile domain-containing protein n=1 Tax=Capsicum annuum TaxID=4072 RepID=A0A2G3AGZ2_CAPAN|nr:putative chaperonin 60 subunit beta 4, chloroplastic-like [Capsicum annuum]PHT93511.1 hypothetical protein T459_01393 [Capsicum annuum]
MKKSKKEIRENARVTRSKVSVGIGKVDDNKSDKKKSKNVCKRHCVYNEEEMEFNLRAIHQDSLGHEHRNDSDHSVPSISEDTFTILKNEIANNVNVGLQTSSASKKQDEVLVDPVIEKYSFGDDVSVRLDVVNNHVNDQSPLDDIPFFTESQLVALEPTFRVLETPKAHIATPIMFDKSPVDVYNQYDRSSRRYPLYFKSKHPFQEYIVFETLNLLIEQFTDWCYPNSKSRGKSDCGMFVCAFVEYVSHGIFDISSRLFDIVNHRIRYGALLWDYDRRKQNDGAISESETTENVTSKHGGFKRSKEQFGSTRTR